MNSILVNIIDKLVIQSRTNPRGRRPAATTKHYLKQIMSVLRSGMQWHHLKSDLHYTTYHKTHMKWCKLGIYELAFKLSLKLAKFSRGELKNLFIDSSMIKNKQGKDCIGANHYDRYRSATKVNVIVTSTGIPLSINVVKANTHDSTLTAEAVNCLNVKVIGSRLIADKGYINNKYKKTILKSHRIKLIYPVRKNQHVKNTVLEINLLKRRSIVEHFFSWLKNYRKIQVRHDKTIMSFEGFIYLASLNILHNKRVVSLE